jgi:hypothetical protein
MAGVDNGHYSLASDVATHHEYIGFVKLSGVKEFAPEHV